MNRRGFIKGAAAGWVYCNSMVLGKAHGFALANSSFQSLPSDKKIIWVLLRGGLDGLHTVVPTQDPHLSILRPNLLKAVQDTLLPLNDDFGLHPKLRFLHDLYQQRQMAPVIATATGYRRRSHFDAQDQLESGLQITDHENGWLARAQAHRTGHGMAIARSVPIALRDPQRLAETWYPSGFPEVEDDLLSRLSDLYQDDAALNQTLAKVISQNNNPHMQINNKQKVNFVSLAENCGKLVATNPAIQCAMLEFNGWDTHINQAGRLANKFAQLDKGLGALRQALGSKWDDTLLVINSEFGRTVAENGTSGTDHGTAGCMFFAGGSINNDAQVSVAAKPLLQGGKVLGTWPGCAPEQLFQARDLRPTSDVRSWLGLALMHHWALTPAQVQQVFPDVGFSVNK